MGGSWIQPDFRAFKTLRSEPAKNSFDPNPNPDQLPNDDPANETENPTISMYQDPRDELDLERHQKRGIFSSQALD
jgi:hypothetical protein